MLLKVSVLNKICQNELLKIGHRAGIKRQTLVKKVGKMHRQHHVADADGGGDGLGEGVQVDDPLGLVDGEQRGDGTAHEAELAVVVVLHDIAPRLCISPSSLNSFSMR